MIVPMMRVVVAWAAQLSVPAARFWGLFAATQLWDVVDVTKAVLVITRGVFVIVKDLVTVLTAAYLVRVGVLTRTVTVDGVARMVCVHHLVVVTHWLTVLMKVDGSGVMVLVADRVTSEAASVRVPVVQRLVSVSCSMVDVDVLVSVVVSVTAWVSVV